MQGDARHAQAKELLEAYWGDATSTERRHLLVAVARLQSLAGTQDGNRLRITHVQRSGTRYPPDFPPAEAALIDAALAAEKSGLKETSMVHYRFELVRFSTWLRRQTLHGRPAYPGGLQDILEIDRRGDLPFVHRLRDQYLSESGDGQGRVRILKPPSMCY